jgi:hypothetical protein
LNFGLHAADLLFDVAIGREDIGVAVQVVIEEEGAESQGQQAGAAYRRRRRFVDKQPSPVMPIIVNDCLAKSGCHAVEAELHREAALLHFAGHAQRVERLELLHAAVGRQVLVHQFIGGLRRE